jgi:hypothetical protein
MKCTQNTTHLHMNTCMHMQVDYFDCVDQLGTSMSIYHKNLNDFERRMLVSACFNVQKNRMHVHACVCIFRQNYYRSDHLQMLDYHPGKFHIDPLVTENIHGQRNKWRIMIIIRNGVKTCSQTSFEERN